ncbi:MAG: WYL domain-containing protein [Oscillospiraceae bacterium]|nr:WYL domain-containing protein [Oscillospiraceae bacterium]MCI2035294.1 WYL domain-containing protein [Oscillospiraceae bacterium]
MPKSENQKLKLLYLKDILLNRTDEEHPMTVREMIEALNGYGIRAERKSIYADLEDLRRYGVDIVCRKSKTTGYFAAGRKFELPELKLLADAVASSKFITEKKSSQLIRKIESLASDYEASQLQRQVFVRGRAKTANEKIYYNVDTIHQAIAVNRPVAFRYFEYSIDWNAPNHWRKHYRRDGEKYAAFPYALTWDDENYYMLAYYEKYQTISHFRVDKMESIEILDRPPRELPDHRSFDLAEYSKKVFGMFSGEEERVTLQLDNSLVGVVLDRFGKDVSIYRADAASFKIQIHAFISPTLLSWIFEFGDKIRILEPESLVEKLREKARESLSVYGPGGGGAEIPPEKSEKEKSNEPWKSQIMH